MENTKEQPMWIEQMNANERQGLTQKEAAKLWKLLLDFGNANDMPTIRKQATKMERFVAGFKTRA